MKKRNIFEKITLTASIILWAFIVFCAGLWTAQTDTFQRAFKDFRSGAAQAEFLPYAKASFDKQLTVWKDVPHALHGGALLVGSQFSSNPALVLVDEDGNILHRWNVEKRLFNPDILQWWKKPPALDIFAIDDAQLLSGGDVIFIQDLRDLTNFRGQRLARMDADSHVKWQVPGAFHHEFDVGGNPQRIYAMASVLRDELPFIGPKSKTRQYIDDRIHAYSMEGKKLDSWSVIDAFARSPYHNLLSSFEIDLPDLQRVESPEGKILYDLVHLNSVQYLDTDHAGTIPQAQEGDLLISLRGINALAVLRPSAGTIVWATLGPWRHQHYARVGEDGKIYVYDNEGSTMLAQTEDAEPQEAMQSRVIRFDPRTHWWEDVFSSPDLHSYWRGYYHSLPDGYAIISSSQQSRVVVVSPQKKVVWELRGVPSRKMQAVPYRKQISTVRYCPADTLGFLHSSRKMR